MSGLTEGKPMSDDEGKALRLKEEGNAALGLAKFAEVRERLLNKRGRKRVRLELQRRDGIGGHPSPVFVGGVVRGLEVSPECVK